MSATGDVASIAGGRPRVQGMHGLARVAGTGPRHTTDRRRAAGGGRRAAGDDRHTAHCACLRSDPPEAVQSLDYDSEPSTPCLP
jgi:hypothetical protein